MKPMKGGGAEWMGVKEALREQNKQKEKVRNSYREIKLNTFEKGALGKQTGVYSIKPVCLPISKFRLRKFKI